MWKLIILIIIISLVDLKNLSIKEQKKEFVIYVFMCLIAISLGIYAKNPSVYIMDIIQNITKP